MNIYRSVWIQHIRCAP